ncbi:MAG: serine/threonine protein kinase, partial [Gemmataceae bacterium]|nr:serine/threonine protein kinase [Gemmataceae bacterium]
MPAPATADEFLDVLRRSRQVDERRLDAHLSGVSAATAQKPRKLAAQLIRAGLITVFQAEQFLLGKTKGFAIGSYRILERLGTGGTGTVYLAEHEVMRRRVAIKVLPAPLASDPVQLERFRREAQATAMLDHPNVVHVFDFREEKGLHAIVMEYVEGPSLQQLLSRRGPQPVANACEYARQAALGLQHAHDAGLVHRDVKPANLLVDAAGAVKVLDMGLARYQAEGEASLTQQFNSKMVMGTADFLAPEQALSLHNVDQRADVYALGATLFALLAGKPPFADGSIGQKLLWHQTIDPPRLDQVRPEVPAALASLVARMMSKKPDDRPGSCAEVAKLLEPFSQGVSVRPSKRTLAEFSLAARTVASPTAQGTSSRLLAPPVAPPDTLSAQADDTGRMPAKAPVAEPAG